MTTEGMVNALKEIHRLLKPGGILIDIHPLAIEVFIEAYQNGRVLFAEPKPDYSTEEFRQADEALAQAVQGNLFFIEQSEQFDFMIYASSLDELFDFNMELNAFEKLTEEEILAERQAEIYARVEEIRKGAGAGAEVASHDRVHISRLRPVK